MPLSAEAIITSGPGKPPQGESRINKVGNLLLAEGIAVLTETTLTINATQNGQTQAVLQGNVFKTSVGSSGNVSGFVHFTSGTMLSQLQANTHTNVSKTDGTKQSLQLVSVSTQSINGRESQVPVPEVSHVHAPHIYTFEISSGENPSCLLRPTCNCLIRKRFVMALLLIGLACAITLPIVIPLAARGGGGNNWRPNSGAAPGYAGGGGGVLGPVVSPAAAGGGGPSSSGGGGGPGA